MEVAIDLAMEASRQQCSVYYGVTQREGCGIG